MIGKKMRRSVRGSLLIAVMLCVFALALPGRAQMPKAPRSPETPSTPSTPKAPKAPRPPKTQASAEQDGAKKPSRSKKSTRKKDGAKEGAPNGAPTASSQARPTGEANERRRRQAVEGVSSIVMAILDRRDAMKEEGRRLNQLGRQLRKHSDELRIQVEDMLDTQREITKKLEFQREFNRRQLKQLVKIFESMRPEQTALVFNELPLGMVVNMIGTMRGAKAAKILALLQTARGTLVSTTLMKKMQNQGEGDVDGVNGINVDTAASN